MFCFFAKHRIYVPSGNTDYIDHKSELPSWVSFVNNIAKVRHGYKQNLYTRITNMNKKRTYLKCFKSLGNVGSNIKKIASALLRWRRIIIQYADQTYEGQVKSA